MKKLLPILMLIVGVAVGAAAVKVVGAGPALAVAAPAQPPAAPAPTPAATRVDDPKAVYRVPLEDSPVRGAADALVTVVEVSDFECPFCRRVAPTLKQLDQAYPGKLRFSFKHNPLPFHASAGPAAVVAEEARAQGGDARFWAVHDRLFEQPALDAAALTRVAREAGLDETRLKKALVTGGHMDRIRRDQGLVGSLGATGTPTFFINGRKVVGAQPLEAFKAVVEEELARAEALVKAGVAPRDVYARTIERGATAPVTMPGPPAAPAPAARTDVKVALRPDDPLRGPASAKVTVVEFSDFQCPYCSRAVPAVKELEQSFGQEVRLAWKHLPLSFHQNAMPAALAAEAARDQGRFWEMHDKLFAGQATLSDAAYLQYASELKLDLTRFQATMKAPATRQRIEADLAAATAAGVSGTPTFVVNGELVVGAGGLKDAVDRQLRRARAAAN
jgi:protein-disulfide isomerase